MDSREEYYRSTKSTFLVPVEIWYHEPTDVVMTFNDLTRKQCEDVVSKGLKESELQRAKDAIQVAHDKLVLDLNKDLKTDPVYQAIRVAGRALGMWVD